MTRYLSEGRERRRGRAPELVFWVLVASVYVIALVAVVVGVVWFLALL